MTSQEKAGPLRGVKVIELAGIGPAPYACMLLSDMGAEVLRLERATGTLSGVIGGYDILARGRRTVAIDLKAEGSRELVLDLVQEADVLIEAFRPGVAERLGVGPDDCLGSNPRLVYARMTGWGQHGPLANRVGHDINYASITGAIAAIGEKDRKPVPPLNLVADFGGGSMFCVMGILAALVERNTSGQGQVIDVAMVDGVTSLLSMAHSQRSVGMGVDARASNLLDGGAPFYDTYRCADGEYMSVGAIEPQFYAALKETLELPDLPSQAERDRYEEVREMLAAKFAEKTRDEWAAIFDEVDACVAPVMWLTEALDHPHLVARQTLVELDGVKQPAPAPRFSRTPGKPGARPKPPGSDTVEALGDWGIEDTRIKQLLESGAVTQAQT
ncbi:MAG TPA: CaiB/BaiF CoA-transferase family protein [Mycobacteriales bacterium]|nr:CaiB/BaiF CoA-transferase family protein [Mycobacteriales bacterium]